MEINDRLRLIREHTGESQSKFCKRFSLPQQTYANYELNKRNIPDDLKTKLYTDLGINLNWLVTGRGAMLRDENSFTENQTTLDEPNKYTHLVPMTNLKVSAGVGSEWESGDEDGDMLPIPMHIYRMYKSYDLAGVTVAGDSMEPTLRDGEPVVYAKGVLEGDGIYVISILNELFVKRLSIDQLDKTVTIISDNPMYSKKIYPIDREGFQILGKVIFWLHMEQRLRVMTLA